MKKILEIQDNITDIDFLRSKINAKLIRDYNQALKDLNLMAYTALSKHRLLELPIINDNGELIKRTRQTYTPTCPPKLGAVRDVVISRPYKEATQETPTIKEGHEDSYTTMLQNMSILLGRSTVISQVQTIPQLTIKPEIVIDVTNCWDAHSPKVPDTVMKKIHKLVHKSTDPRHEWFWKFIQAYKTVNTITAKVQSTAILDVHNKALIILDHLETKPQDIPLKPRHKIDVFITDVQFGLHVYELLLSSETIGLKVKV